jgi:CheY-like chemotaxis protein
MKVLLVEDDAIIRMLISAQLTNKGQYVITAKNGVHALEVLEENPNIDIIITDIMMPHMDGIQLAENLKSSPFKHLPIIAITAGTYLEDNQGSPSPFAEVLTKPVYIQDLIDQIQLLIDKPSN